MGGPSSAVEDKKRFAFLGELLVDEGVITEDQLRLAIEEQKRRKAVLGEILVGSGFCTNTDIAKGLATQLGLDYADVASEEVDEDVARLLGQAFLRSHLIVPLVTRDPVIRMAVADPFDVETSTLVETRCRRPVVTVVGTRSAILEAIDAISSGGDHIELILDGLDQREGQGAQLLDQVSPEELVETLAREAIRRDATDIHIEPESHVLRVRYRVDGVLTDGPMINAELGPALTARIKVMADMDLSEHRLPQDGRATLALDGTTLDWRISTLPTVLGETVVIRVLDGRTALLDPRELGLSPGNYQGLMELCARPHGIILVTGPTGSGKSTTLYSLLHTIDGLKKKIITVEDPVEYRIPLVRQVQTHAEIGLTFARAVRAILRQDPDVILIGEIRDRETAEIAVRAALTGHLVFSTLHTNSALGAIPRLVDMGIDPFLLKSSLIGVLAQRLVRRVCTRCSTVFKPTKDEWAVLQSIKTTADVRLTQANGCAQCRHTGYAGRTGIHELLMISDAMKKISFGDDGGNALGEIARAEGFVTLNEDGLQKALQGLTTVEEISGATVTTERASQPDPSQG